jgi:hypothetical protein
VRAVSNPCIQELGCAPAERYCIPVDRPPVPSLLLSSIIVSRKNKQEAHMRYTKVALFGILALALAFVGCTKQKASEAPKQEYMTKSLVPAKVETKGESVTVTAEDLRVSWTVNVANQEITETPTLRGSFKVVNTSKDLLEVQGVTVEYVDSSGSPIAFQSGEKIAKASLMLTSIKPGESSDGTLDVTFPRAAIKALDKIKVNVVYIPSPLKRETLTLPQKVE